MEFLAPNPVLVVRAIWGVTHFMEDSLSCRLSLLFHFSNEF